MPSSSTSASTPPPRPLPFVAFSAGHAVRHVPPAELQAVSSLPSLGLDAGFAAAVPLLVRGPLFADAAAPYAVLRSLAQRADRPAAHDALFVCLYGAAPSGRVTLTTWETLACALGDAVGGIDAPPDPDALALLRDAWKPKKKRLGATRKAMSIIRAKGKDRLRRKGKGRGKSKHTDEQRDGESERESDRGREGETSELEPDANVAEDGTDAVDFYQLLDILREYDGGLVVMLRALAVVLVDAVRRRVKEINPTAHLPPILYDMPDTEEHGTLLSQYALVQLERIQQEQGGSSDRAAEFIGAVEKEEVEEEATIADSSGEEQDHRAEAETESSSKVTSPSTVEGHTASSKSLSLLSRAAQVRRTAQPRGRTPFHIDFSALQLGERIGAGAYGEVFRARYLHSPVAVKVFHVNVRDASAAPNGNNNNALMRMSTARALQRFASRSSQLKYRDFVREVELMSLVRHPNVVLYMGACGDPSTPLCIVSELFTGGSLHEYLHSQEPSALPSHKNPTLRDSLSLATGVALGMHYLHASTPAILHRDLKPSNILLSGGATPRAVICDFGLCQLFGEGDSAATGDTMGTATYMSPDVIQGAPYEGKDDVYSYGVLLHELFTRRQPFAGLAPVQVMFQVAGQGRRPAYEPQDVVPNDVRKLIDDCWHTERAKRPTFEAIITELNAISTCIKL